MSVSDKKLLDEALRVLGDDWTFLITRAAYYGVARFESFQSTLAMSRPRLAERLKHLCTLGVFAKIAYQDRPVRYEYRFTEMGKSIYPIALAMIDWANIYRPDPKGAPLPEVIHLPCGESQQARLICSACNKDITLGSIREASPAGCRMKPDLATFRQRWSRSNRPRAITAGLDPSSRAAEVIADRWIPMIIDRALVGIQRFDALQGELAVSRNVLTDRLNFLEMQGLLKKEPYQQGPERFNYVPTDAARALYPALVLLRAWARRWLVADAKDCLLTHITCGQACEPLLVCKSCEKPIHVDEKDDALLNTGTPDIVADPAPTEHVQAQLDALAVSGGKGR